MERGSFYEPLSYFTDAAQLPRKHIRDMRLDKYLKVSRLIKRRTIANEACDAGRLCVNGRVARASLEIKEGDTIEIGFGDRKVSVRVLTIKETTKKADSEEMFEYI